MPCYKPLNAYRCANSANPTKILFLKSGSSMPTNAEYLRIPCGQCIGCRLDRSRMWATRCMHEAELHENNSFVTLTYDSKHLPRDNGLVKSHYQLFMKRLRKWGDQFGYTKLKYLHSAEYGDEYQRPHYHACIFGVDFPDKILWKTNHQDDPIYTSRALDIIWGKGFTTLGDVTYQSAAYTARYALKKINGKRKNIPDPTTGLLPYERTHLDSAEIVEVLPEYSTQSRNPGLGQGFIKEYLSDIYPWDEVIINGHPTRPPRYYDDYYQITTDNEMEIIKQRRIQTMEKHSKDNTRARLSQREAVKEAQSNKLMREL